MSETAEKINKKIAYKIRELRLLQGTTQQNLANALDISFQQIQKYEKGVNRISAARLYQIAQLLGIPITRFFEDAFEDAPLQRITTDGMLMKNATLIGKLNALHPDLQKIVMDLIVTFSKNKRYTIKL